MNRVNSNNSDKITAQMVVSRPLPSFEVDGSFKDDKIRVRAASKRNLFAKTDARFDELYFHLNFMYSEFDFEGRFCMPRKLFDRVMSGPEERGIFVQKYDVTRKGGTLPRMRVIASLRDLGYGLSINKVYEALNSLLCPLMNAFFRSQEKLQVLSAVYSFESNRIRSEKNCRE